MVFRGKRAEGIISFLFSALFSLILAAFFIIAVFMRVKSAAEDSSFQKRFYARDMALLVDSMHAANGEVIIGYEFIYPSSMSLEAMLEPDKVSITDADKITLGQKAPTSFLFGHNDQMRVNISTVKDDMSSFNIILRDEKLEFYTGIKQDVSPVLEDQTEQ